MPHRTRRMLKSKIHRATVTDANLNYEGSITIDTDLLALADIRTYEQVFVVNINTGARFETYAIEGPAGQGDMCLNGAAARLAETGDLVIVMTYAEYTDAELDDHYPIVVHVDGRNCPAVATSSPIPATVPADGKMGLPEGWNIPGGGPIFTRRGRAVTPGIPDWEGVQ